jgi:hypothetical protein
MSERISAAAQLKARREVNRLRSSWNPASIHAKSFFCCRAGEAVFGRRQGLRKLTMKAEGPLVSQTVSIFATS